MDYTYSTSFINEVEITNVESWPPPPLPPSVNVYSQDISGDFPILSVCSQFLCNGNGFSSYCTNSDANSVQEVADIFNADPNFNQYGFYFDDRNGRLGLTILESLLNTICPSGDMTLRVQAD